MLEGKSYSDFVHFRNQLDPVALALDRATLALSGSPIAHILRERARGAPSPRKGPRPPDRSVIGSDHDLLLPVMRTPGV